MSIEAVVVCDGCGEVVSGGDSPNQARRKNADLEEKPADDD